MTGRKLLSLLSDFRLSTIHWLEGVDDAGAIDSPTILQIAWSIAYSYYSSGRPLLKDFDHDDDGEGEEKEEDGDNDDDDDVANVNRVEMVYKTMEAIHTITQNTTSLNDQNNQPTSNDQLHSKHNHPQIKTVDVKRLESTVEDIVLHVFFAGAISDEINDEVTNDDSDDDGDAMTMIIILKLLDCCCIDCAPFDGGSS